MKFKKDTIYIIEWEDPTSYNDEPLTKELTRRFTCGRVEVKRNRVYVIYGWFKDTTDNDMDYLVLPKSLIKNHYALYRVRNTRK